MVAKAKGDPGRLPANRLHSLDRHEPMSNLTDDVGRSEAVDDLVFDAFEELSTGWSECRIRFEMVNEDAGIHKNSGAIRQVPIGHDCSCGSSSGLRATKSASS